MMNLVPARVLQQEPVGESPYRLLCLDVPAIAAACRPGQFVHVRVPNLDGSVLRRPFSIYRAGVRTLALLYKPIGRGTEAMRALVAGQEISLMGPLGNGFPLDSGTDLPVLVAGGYGVAPLCLLAAKLPARGIVFIGGATSRDVLCVDDFKQLGWQTAVATQDGSLGQGGLVTEALDHWLAREGAGRGLQFFACGPDGMLKAVGQRAIRGGWKAWLSLDKHMGCGVGACLACVQKIRQPDGAVVWKRVCRDGPVFEAREIVWE
jgi:dihydroorotate dehydrogenase electron transfer subunit